MALLAAETLDLGYRHALNAQPGQGFPYFVEFERLDNRSDELHCGFPEKSELASCPSKRHARFGRNGKPTESGGFIAQARAAGRLTATAAHDVFVDRAEEQTSGLQSPKRNS